MAAPDNVEFGGATSGIVYVEGVVPAGERDISAPIKIGSRAATDPPNPVEPGDVVDAYLDLQGRQVVYHDRPLPEGDNEIGAVNVSKVAGNVTATGAGDTTSGTLRVVVAADDANIAYIQMATEDMVGLIASTLIGDATGSLVKTNLRDADGNEIGTAAKPIHVDIRGEIPDAMDLDRVGGSATDVGSGNAGSGTLRVAVATDDVNLAGILAQLDITQSALRDAIKGAGGKDLSTLETDIESILASTDVALSTRATEATLAAQLDITQSALRDALKGAGGKDLTTLQTALDAVQVAVEKIDDLQDATVAEGAVPTKGIQISLDNGTDTQFAQCDANGSLKTVERGVPVKTAATGSGAIATSYAPSAAFWLDAITIHLSAAPTTAGDLTVTLDATDGAAYDTVLFSLDPSEQSDTDVVYIPDQPLLCVSGDAIAVAYPNTDGRTYGLRIIARLA